jgi:hypothetical protein
MDYSHANECAGTMSTAPTVVTLTRHLARNSRELDARANRRGLYAFESSMDFDCIGEIIATRRLHFVDEGNHKRTVSVFVGKPQQSNGSSDYHCPFQVIGIGSQQTQLARGHDSIQALQSALILIAASLNHLNNELGGKLIWEGGRKGELGFP